MYALFGACRLVDSLSLSLFSSFLRVLVQAVAVGFFVVMFILSLLL
jgi:hypothetical protein